MPDHSIQELYRKLIISEFVFIERGFIDINEIIDEVKVNFHEFFEDDYLDSISSPYLRIKEPEWKFNVRMALRELAREDITVHYSEINGFWEFT
jgi:hypothetical protein